MSVNSHALRIIEKRPRQIKLSITVFSADLLILPTSFVIFPFRSTSVMDVLLKTLSFHSHPKNLMHGRIEWSLRSLGFTMLQMARSSETCQGTAMRITLMLCRKLTPPPWSQFYLSSLFLNPDFIYFRIHDGPVHRYPECLELEIRKSEDEESDGNFVSRALSSMAPNAGYWFGIVICAPQKKNYLHSLSFDSSLVLFGSLQWSHGRSKSASRPLGHPVVLVTPYPMPSVRPEPPGVRGWTVISRASTNKQLKRRRQVD